MSNVKEERDDVEVDPREEEILEKRREIGRLQRELITSTVAQDSSDPGYQAPAIIPELDLEGGTVYRVGEETYETMEDAVEATAPPEADDSDATARVKRARRGADDE